MLLNNKKTVILFFVAGTLLRVLLCWANPPNNAFDDHFEPIFLIMTSGAIPAKDACFQCYHPPVFYFLSAMVGKLAVIMGADPPQLSKILQFIPCLYGVMTLLLIYLILKKLPLSDFSRIIAFGTVCFLPRHIYMSAMNSNDTISYFFVSLTIYILLLAIERKLSILFIGAATIVISITLFTKYTAFVVLPIVLVSFFLLFFTGYISPRKKVVFSLLLIIFLPLMLLGGYMNSNLKNYGRPLPWNSSQLDPSLTQSRDNTAIDFISFTPWETIQAQILTPGKMHKFWNLIYGGMWFDNEPKFLYFIDANFSWWRSYYLWLRGEMPYPGDNPSMGLWTKISGAGLNAAGLLPLLLIIIGVFQYLRNSWGTICIPGSKEIAIMSIFPVLLVSNAAGIIALALRLPVFSAMKASYFLNSLPALAVFLGFGLMLCEKEHKVKVAVAVGFVILFALVNLHIMHIFYSIMF